MSGGFQFYDIIIFALIAVFIILRLRSVLGRRTGNERPNERDFFNNSRSRREDTSGEVININQREKNAEPEIDDNKKDLSNLNLQDYPSEVNKSDDIRSGLKLISNADPDFSAKEFQKGAREAFTMIVDAYSEGDTPTLRPLLGDDVYDQFASAISERIESKHSLIDTVISVDEASFVKAEMVNTRARITVRFVSKQISVTRDSEDNIVEGDEDKVLTIIDIWTFSRNIRSSNPNWLLVETSSE
ncbi:MAG: translocase [Rhodospirillaceae bacterium]|nr:translocase [Rhodospirillaceae bacterium]